MNAQVIPFPAAVEFTPSPAQQAIFDFAANSTRSALIKAVAGAGKTTTMIKMVDYLPKTNRFGRAPSITFLAYNREIADELKSRVPEGVQAKTFHSLGLGALAKAWGKEMFNRIDDKKVKKILERELTEADLGMYGAFAETMVDYAKQEGVGFLVDDVPAEWRRLRDHYDVELDSEHAVLDKGFKIARAALQLSHADAKRSIDYNDMILLPLIHGLALWKNDVLVVDETQDLNPTRRALCRKALAPWGRLFAVGDPRQAIYGFTGASSDSMDQLAEAFDCVELPLTVSYRCPQAVVKAAQQYVPYIQASPAAPLGIVRQSNGVERFRDTDVILCRNTAPLVDLAYGLIASGTGCRIIGRDIGNGLVSQIKRMKAKNIDGLRERIAEWCDREVEDATAKGNERKAEAISDKAAAILTVIDRLPENKRTIPELIRSITGMFEEKGGKLLTLCTAHRSKGKEWSRVFLLGADELMPSKFARQAWQKQQEDNLIYVAYTRAKEELVFLPLQNKEQKQQAA